MRASIPYIKSVFEKYNVLAFNGILPEPPFKLVTSRVMGRTCTMDTMMADGSIQRKATIEISIRYDLPEEEYVDTIVHEMIHYYIWYNQMHDDGPHGTLFLKMMKNISEEYKIKISVVGDYTEHMQIQEPNRLRYVCIAVFEDSSFAMAVVAKNKVLQLWNVFNSVTSISSVTWYATDDPFFGRFPTTVSPRLFGIDGNIVLPHLKEAVELENSGTVISPRGQE